jgi:hypothetical protein
MDYNSSMLTSQLLSVKIPLAVSLVISKDFLVIFARHCAKG